MRGCYAPPKKLVIWDALAEELQKHALDLGISVMEKVTMEWLLLMLSTANPDHAIFAPDFQPVVQKP